MSEKHHLANEARLKFSDEEIQRRKQFVSLEDSDLGRIASIRHLVVSKADEFTDFFFERLRSAPEAAALFENTDILDEVRHLKRDHLIAMVSGNYGREYALQRIKIGMLYSHVGLDTRVFLGAFHELMTSIGRDIMAHSGEPPAASFEIFMSVKKVCFMDIGMIVDVLIDERERMISAQQTIILEANRELEAFSYSVAHDLRTPLRGIDGFSLALLEDYGDKFDEEGQQALKHLRQSAQKMAVLINALLGLSRISRSELKRERINLSALAEEIAADLRADAPDRQVDLVIADNLSDTGDPALIRIALQNLLANAWKFTAKRERATIEFGASMNSDRPIYHVRDNGAGFDMEYASKLFGVFQRLHSAVEFEGTGIGLATVHRIVRRHGGQIWADSAVDKGAAFHFTIGRGAS